MNRTDFQRMASLRLREAKALHAAGLYSGAYYLAGYAIEFALKSCIARRFAAGDWPEKKFVEKIWKHDLGELLSAAELTDSLQEQRKALPDLDTHWAAVKDWNESERYCDTTTVAESSTLLSAIEGPTNGILPWLQQRW